MGKKQIINLAILILLSSCENFESRFGKETLTDFGATQIDLPSDMPEDLLSPHSDEEVLEESDPDFEEALSAEPEGVSEPAKENVQGPQGVNANATDEFIEEVLSDVEPSESPQSNVTQESNSVPQPEITAYKCRDPRKYTYSIPDKVSLYCNSFVDVLNVNIPDSGRAVAVLSGTIYNRQPAGRPYAIHSWSGYASLGGGAETISSGSGESVCGQQNGVIQLMSYGELKEGSQNLNIKLQQYLSSKCSNGALSLMPGATVEVWVEDDHPSCVGKNITAKSYFRTIWDQYGMGAQSVVHPQTYMTPVLNASMDLKKDRPVRVYSQVQTSVDSTLNTCGGQYETAGAFLSSTGVYQGLSKYENVLPVSGGITHGLYYPNLAFTPSVEGAFTAALSAYVNQTKNAGGVSKVGENYSGDSVIFIIQE